MRRTAAVLGLLWLWPVTAAADWDAQVSTRWLVGGGAYLAEQSLDVSPLFELALRADVLLGDSHPELVRFGPALDLRTEGFRTLEAGGGLAVYFPTGGGWGFTTTVGGGWGARPEGRDGGFGLAQIAMGYRPYNYYSAYAYALNIYASARVQLEPAPRVWEITLGIEVDFEFTLAIPAIFLWELATATDPDEPD